MNRVYNFKKLIKLESIKISATAKTPQVDFNHLTGELVFTGRSIPENAAKLYEDVLKWVKDYAEQPNLLTNFRLNLEYFNTPSIIWIGRMIKVLSSMKRTDATLIIHLYYDINDFANMDSEELTDAISPIIDMTGTPTVSIGIKIYGIDAEGQILKETMALI